MAPRNRFSSPIVGGWRSVDLELERLASHRRSRAEFRTQVERWTQRTHFVWQSARPSPAPEFRAARHVEWLLEVFRSCPSSSDSIEVDALADYFDDLTRFVAAAFGHVCGAFGQRVADGGSTACEGRQVPTPGSLPVPLRRRPSVVCDDVFLEAKYEKRYASHDGPE